MQLHSQLREASHSLAHAYSSIEYMYGYISFVLQQDVKFKPY